MMFGGAKKWADRTVKPKDCKRCGQRFTPSCGGNVYCLHCVNEVKRENHARGQREWRAKNPKKHAEYKTNLDLMNKYGITLNVYREILGAQGGGCAICGDVAPRGRGKHRLFVVDHCHTTGKVRGLLCAGCNTAIGLFGEDEQRMKSAIKYIRRSA